MLINNQQVIKIGKGKFSTAYRIIDSDVVIIATKTNDLHANNNVKEIYTHIEAKHVPYMSTIDTEIYIPKIGYVNLYESRFYMPLTAKSRQAWADYKVLRDTWNQIMAESYNLTSSTIGGEYDKRHVVCDNFIRHLEDNNLVSEELIKALDSIYTWSTAYGSGFLFEFSPRNLKVDSDGNLILLDIVFFSEPNRNREG